MPLHPRPLRALATAAAVVALVLGPVTTASACADHEAKATIARARAATAPYHRLPVAERAGYAVLADTAGLTCIADPAMGAMGVHYVKGDLVADPAVDVTRPEALVYAPDRHGRLHLAALEYVVLKDSWSKPEPPMLYGRMFDLTAAPNRYGLPAFYSLHAWVWTKNPAGTFAMWNPRVHCPAAEAPASAIWGHGR